MCIYCARATCSSFQVPLQVDTEEGERQLQTQKAALGALAVSLIDVRCRAQYLAVEPSLATVLHAVAVLPGYPDDFQQDRRIVAAKALAASVQRDAFVRDCLVRNVRRSPGACATAPSISTRLVDLEP